MSSNSLTIIRILLLFFFFRLQIRPDRHISRATRRATHCVVVRAWSSSVAVAVVIRPPSSSGIRTVPRSAWPTGTTTCLSLQCNSFTYSLTFFLSFFFFVSVFGRTSGRLSENIYSFTAEAGDNKARFRCEASNVMSQTPLKAEVDLAVLCKCNTHATHTHTYRTHETHSTHIYTLYTLLQLHQSEAAA